MKACLWNVLTLLSHFFSLSALVRFRHETIVCRQTIFYQGFIEITRLKLFMTFLFQEGQKKVCVWGEAAGDSFTTEVREHGRCGYGSSGKQECMRIGGHSMAIWDWGLGGGRSTAGDGERYGRSGIHYKVKKVEMQDVENCCVKDKCVFRDVKIIFR